MMDTATECYSSENERKKNMNPLEYEDPPSLEEAEARREELVAAIQSIQTQLGARNRTDSNGRRLTFREYSEWRVRAAHSHAMKSAELRYVNRWIKKTRKSQYDAKEKKSIDSALIIVKRMHTMIVQLKDDGVELTKDEEAQIKEAEHFLRLYQK